MDPTSDIFSFYSASEHSQLQAFNLIEDSLLAEQGQMQRRQVELWEGALGTWSTWGSPFCCP